VSSITGSGLSDLSQLPSEPSLSSSPSTAQRPSESFSGPPQVYPAPKPPLGVASIVGYAIGALGLLVALFVLLFMRR
jgi:hypothetical protein